MSVRIERPLTAPGHEVRFESTPADSKRLTRYWVVCSCGWRTNPEQVNIHHHALAHQHLGPYVEHDLTVAESGAFVRAECTCDGWVSDTWHHNTFRLAMKHMKTEHAGHCAAVARRAREDGVL